MSHCRYFGRKTLIPVIILQTTIVATADSTAEVATANEVFAAAVAVAQLSKIKQPLAVGIGKYQGSPIIGCWEPLH